MAGESLKRQRRASDRRVVGLPNDAGPVCLSLAVALIVLLAIFNQAFGQS